MTLTHLQLENLIKAAETGNAYAQYVLASIYLDDCCEFYDAEKAFPLFKAAAEQGHISAQEELALMYMFGEGCDEDPDEALRWLLLVANRNIASAQCALGEYYYEEGNYALAFKLASRAAQAGYQNAMELLVKMYRTGNGTVCDDTAAQMWMDKYKNWTESDEIPEDELLKLPVLNDEE